MHFMNGPRFHLFTFTFYQFCFHLVLFKAVCFYRWFIRILASYLEGLPACRQALFGLT